MRTGPQDSTGSSSALQADLTQLGGHGQYIRDIADKQYQYHMNIRQQIETLKGGWKSPAATAYCDQVMPDWDTHATDHRNALYALADAIESGHKAYGSMEEQNLSQINQANQYL